MRVVQVCPRYWPHIGGVETHVREISRKLVERGFDVEVLATDPSGKLPEEEIIDCVKVKRFNSFAPNESYFFSPGLRKYLRKKSDSFDIVHAHSYHAFPALYAAQSKGRNKLVFNPHYHGTGHTLFRSLLHIPYRFLGSITFQKADEIICVSNYEKELIVNQFNVDKNKIAVIPNGVNLEEFKGLEKRSKTYLTILYVGRLEKYKGVQHIIRALSNLPNDIVLELVGKGPYKECLVKLARNLNVKDRVRFYQDLPRTQLLQKYADADVFMLLSKHEAFGIVVEEALAAKTPCVLANTSGLKEWIYNENCLGVNFPIKDDELIAAISKVIGRELHEVKVWDWEEIVGTLIELYKNVAEV
jgi:glycosyltransferase involved in cell wall biosynthesis